MQTSVETRSTDYTFTMYAELLACCASGLIRTGEGTFTLVATDRVVQDFMEVFTWCDCDNSTSPYSFLWKQKQVTVANRTV